jgi:hypothetical protein
MTRTTSTHGPRIGPEGLTARRSPNRENIILLLEDGVSTERLVILAHELSEGLSRLESQDGNAWRSEALEMHDIDLSEQVSFGPDRMPTVSREPAGDYRIAEVALESPTGFLMLRRVMLNGPDVLELDTPSGSVYEFDYAQTLRYLQSMLPH